MSKTLSWTQDNHSTVETGAVAFDASKFKGFEIEVDGAPAVVVPVAFSDAGQYSIDGSTVEALKAPGKHQVDLKTVVDFGDGAGAVESAASATVEFDTPFPPAVPAAPVLTVS